MTESGPGPHVRVYTLMRAGTVRLEASTAPGGEHWYAVVLSATGDRAEFDDLRAARACFAAARAAVPGGTESAAAVLRAAAAPSGTPANVVDLADYRRRRRD